MKKKIKSILSKYYHCSYTNDELDKIIEINKNNDNWIGAVVANDKKALENRNNWKQFLRFEKQNMTYCESNSSNYQLFVDLKEKFFTESKLPCDKAVMDYINRASYNVLNSACENKEYKYNTDIFFSFNNNTRWTDSIEYNDLLNFSKCSVGARNYKKIYKYDNWIALAVLSMLRALNDDNGINFVFLEKCRNDFFLNDLWRVFVNYCMNKEDKVLYVKYGDIIEKKIKNYLLLLNKDFKNGILHNPSACNRIIEITENIYKENFENNLLINIDN